MVLPDLNFTPPEEGDVHILEGEHAGTLSNAKQSYSYIISEFNGTSRFVLRPVMKQNQESREHRKDPWHDSPPVDCTY
jgi:hypothetical protein